MKDRIITLLLLCASTSLSAKPRFSISANYALNNVVLRNETDRQYPNLFEAKTATKPSYGIVLSYTDPSKKGYQGVSLGIEYTQYAQSTRATSPSTTKPNSGKSSTDLRYLRMPLMVRLGWGKFGRFEPYLTAGLYAALLVRYTEYSRTDFQFGSEEVFETTTHGEYHEITTSAKGSRSSFTVFKIENGLYHSFDWGAQSAIGTDYRINKQIIVGIRIQASYGFTDIERKGELPENKSFPYFWPQEYYPESTYWDYNSPKSTNDPDNKVKRSATNIFAYGIALSVGYTF